MKSTTTRCASNEPHDYDDRLLREKSSQGQSMNESTKAENKGNATRRENDGAVVPNGLEMAVRTPKHSGRRHCSERGDRSVSPETDRQGEKSRLLAAPTR